jgi:hypothetical protein
MVSGLISLLVAEGFIEGILDVFQRGCGWRVYLLQFPKIQLFFVSLAVFGRE